MSAGIAILTISVVLYAALAGKLGRWSITMPMVFVAIGFLLGPLGAGLLALSPEAETVRVFTEITLALLLFADASTLTFGQVVDDAGLSARLLAFGLPLTMVLGAARRWYCCPARVLLLPACWVQCLHQLMQRSVCLSSTTRACRCASGERSTSRVV